ncbi:MAG: hypothetical protein P9F19_01420 [Candidatus Contendobacter sp.]|nr:hypothetical protein [Candidatus Contendobacter sp.]MDG4556049.1 hypothetical protein [Candidatus Contendobacter sp.]
MSFDDDLQQQFERCHTFAELTVAVRETLARHGRDNSDKWVRFIIKSYCGGTRVEVDASGKPVNPWRRKFLYQEPEAAQPAARREAA